MNIFTKLLTTLVFTSIILLSILFIVVQWGLTKGMLEYVNKKELQSLQLLSSNLASYYQQTGSWDRIKLKVNAPVYKGPRRPPMPDSVWIQILRLSKELHVFPKDVIGYLKENQPTNDFERHPPAHRRPPPEARRRPFKGEAEPPHPEGYAGPNSVLLPDLLDANKNNIIGRSKIKRLTKEIKVDGEVVGYLAITSKNDFTDNLDLKFVEDSKYYLAMSFLVIFLITTIISILLSRHLVNPIKHLESQIRLLNKGKYKTKIEIKGKDELASLAQNFNDLAQTLDRNKISRDIWLANVSHELRTPVAIIKAEIEAMLDGVRILDFNALNSLAEEINHLQKLISDLATLSHSDIGAMSYQKQKINFAELCQSNLQRHQSSAKQLNLSLNINIPMKKVAVWGDVTRLNQLIDNLLTNCFKYTQSPGSIFISLNKEKNCVSIIIEDTTPSVPTASLPKLFDHLYRVESSRNRKTGGAGIGLALCKNIIEAHQGSISAEKSEHGGLLIQCKLPTTK
ncbi:MAG: HAMP domain-containing protein [Psychromonas sp.]|nr:HAMP domain-containing protein [Psychromonas sp.]